MRVMINKLNFVLEWLVPGVSKVKSAYKPKWPIRPELIPVSVALSD